VLRQALAALGQASLIAFWQQLSNVPVAQVLLTHDDLRNRRRYLNARASLRELLRLGALPVINENDTVAVDELKLGDNDNLAAAVASLVDADLLLIATDIGGLYSGHP
ncbi:glutamate 5-kinase, partial [Lysobacter sp. 2RAB21]